MRENEARVLKINIEVLLKKIYSMDLDFISANFQERYVYDFTPPQKGKWIRLRSNGIKTTLTIKEIIDNTISGTNELEVEVSDFKETNFILNEMGYFPRSYQENFRIEFKNKLGKFDIDFWPQIDPCFEIESFDEKTVEMLFAQFGYSKNDIITQNIDAIYRNIYGIDLNKIKKLEFDSRNFLVNIENSP